jgi:hypothetical protein
MPANVTPGPGNHPPTQSWSYADELPVDVAGALVATATVSASGEIGEVEITWDPAVSPTAHGQTDAVLDQPEEQVALITTASRNRAAAESATRVASLAIAHQVQQGTSLRAALQAVAAR